MFAKLEFIVYYESCCKDLLFMYMLISLFSFRFLLDTIMNLDFSSLKLILLFFAHAVILVIFIFDIFSAALVMLLLIASIKSSAKVTTLVCFMNGVLKSELYWIFQYPGPEQDPCGAPFVTVLCNTILLDKILADLSLK